MSRCRSNTTFPKGAGSEGVAVRCQYPAGHIDRHTFIIEWGTGRKLERAA
jgi:hypothetical protein